MFLDECGFSLNLYRLYGWASSSERCVESVPLARGQNRSLVGGFSLSGMVASLQKVGSIKRVDFETFLSEHLLPVLPTGSVLVLDNARSHHGGQDSVVGRIVGMFFVVFTAVLAGFFSD